MGRLAWAKTSSPVGRMGQGGGRGGDGDGGGGDRANERGGYVDGGVQDGVAALGTCRLRI